LLYIQASLTRMCGVQTNTVQTLKQVEKENTSSALFVTQPADKCLTLCGPFKNRRLHISETFHC